MIRGLYDGRFEPGHRLIEAELTEQYGVSRGPVREALNRLAAMGVVDLLPQRGAQVRILSLEEAIDSLIVAQGLVGIAARLAAERRKESAEGLGRLKAAMADIMCFDQASNTANYATARDTFYATLTSLAGNAALGRLLPQLQIHLIRVEFRAILRTVDRRRHRDYRDIAEAVAAGDPKRAEKAARTHLGRSVIALQAFRSMKTAA